MLAEFALSDAGPANPSFGKFSRLLAHDSLRSHAEAVHAASKPAKHFRALTLVGGQTVQSEQIAYNDFGRVLCCFGKRA